MQDLKAVTGAMCTAACIVLSEILQCKEHDMAFSRL